MCLSSNINLRGDHTGVVLFKIIYLITFKMQQGTGFFGLISGGICPPLHTHLDPSYPIPSTHTPFSSFPPSTSKKERGICWGSKSVPSLSGWALHNGHACLVNLAPPLPALRCNRAPGSVFWNRRTADCPPTPLCANKTPPPHSSASQPPLRHPLQIRKVTWLTWRWGSPPGHHPLTPSLLRSSLYRSFFPLSCTVLLC